MHARVVCTIIDLCIYSRCVEGIVYIPLSNPHCCLHPHQNKQASCVSVCVCVCVRACMCVCVCVCVCKFS